MKNNIFLVLLSLPFLLIGCKPKPSLNVVVKASFKVIPNIEKIQLGDTLRLTLNANANFPTTGGGTYFFNDGFFSIPFFIGEIDLSDITFRSRVSDYASFRILSQSGNFEYNSGTGTGMFGKMNSRSVNNEYNVDVSIIPQKKDTFFIQVSRGTLYNGQQSVGIIPRFETDTNNLEILPNGVVGSSQVTQTYAFIVE